MSVSYHSYCGGIPALANDFKYKFSWSPVGVIKALNSEAKFIENFVENSKTPYKYIKNYSINNETFEAYPNRNSLPYIKEYLFPSSWKIKEFVRGTLRLNGWTKAWENIFKILEVNFKGINVLENQSLREGIKTFSDWPTIPQLYLKKEFIGGCDIIKEMYESGELKKILDSKGISYKK